MILYLIERVQNKYVKCIVYNVQVFNQVDASLLRATHLRTSLRV